MKYVMTSMNLMDRKRGKWSKKRVGAGNSGLAGQNFAQNYKKKIDFLAIFHCGAVKSALIVVYLLNLVHPGHPDLILAKIFGILA